MKNNWKVKDTGGSAKIISDNGTIATIIRTSKGTPQEKMANARLMAAAPELLDALINLVNLVGELDFSGFDTKGENPQDWTKQANAAITKAQNG